MLVTIFATWSVLMHSYDLTHVPLFLLSVLPLGGALAVGFAAGSDQPAGLHGSRDTTGLVAVIALVMLSAVIEVVGHEKVGYPHTLRAVAATAADR